MSGDELLQLPRVAVVIPAYRAAGTIAGVIAGIPSFVARIVVVDDASPDDLSGVVTGLADPRVRLVSHPENRGVGAAVMTGYRNAVADGAQIVVKMDADGQMDPGYLVPLVLPIARGAADYTKGNRFLHSQELRSMPRVRLFGNAVLSLLTKFATGYWSIFDPTNGYTAVDGSVVRAIDERRIAPRYFFESSMLIELARLRAVVEDVYIPAIYRGEVSSLSKRAAVGEFSYKLLASGIRRIFVQYYVRDFSAVSLYLFFGLVFLLFGGIWGAIHWVDSVQTNVPATTGTVMIAVLPIILGAQLVLQAITLDIQHAPTRPIHETLRALEHARMRHS